MCLLPTQSQQKNVKRMESLTALLLTKEDDPREDWGYGGGLWEEGWQECEIHTLKPPNMGCSSFDREHPQANNNSHPNHPAVSHLVPDRQTLIVNAFILSKCCMLVCLLGRICHYKLTFVPRAKIPVISEIPSPTLTLKTKRITRE